MEGMVEGDVEGTAEGIRDGAPVGTFDGCAEGEEVGLDEMVGLAVGALSQSKTESSYSLSFK
jgi:hypothetical protein